MAVIGSFLVLTTICTAAFSAPDGRIRGRVVDAITGDALPGANVVVKGTTIGAATELDGQFVITRVPAGEVTLVISYLGYVEKEVVIGVEDDRTTELRIVLDQLVLEGDEVVISVQAMGQRGAINQQISSATMKNVVSSAKIQELPEANVAEAVGRLPGVTLEREGGEGTKVVIRGLSPRYSKLQIEGVTLSSTDAGDRSTDLSMISAFMLDGIELTKAATADQEADQIGGTVEFKLREAQPKPSFNLLVQGGYNNLRATADDFKFVVGGGNRFADEKLGVYLNLDIDRINRGENSGLAGYEIRGDTLAIANSATYLDTDRVKNRFGGSVVVDYELPSTKLKFFTIYNEIREEETQFREILDPAAFTHRYFVDDSEDKLSMMSNAVTLDHYLGNVKLSAGLSYNFTEREVPDGIQMNTQENNAFPITFSHAVPLELGDLRGQLITEDRGFLHPSEFSTQANNDLSTTFVEWIFSYDSRLFQDQYAADLATQFDLRFSDNLTADVEVGGRYKRQSREFDLNSFEHPMWWTTVDEVRNLWFEELQGSPFLDEYAPGSTNFPFGPFVDQEYDPDDFFNSELSLILDVEEARRLIEMIDRTDEGFVRGLQRNFNTSVPNDYDGSEDYYAAYIMPTVRVGEALTFIPGLRYEKNKTEYTGVRASALGQWDEPFAFDTPTTERKNSFLLPMIHLRYDVNDWLDVRSSYTETLSRPSYNLITPAWIFSNPTSLFWNNPELEPLESTNYDLTFSVYPSKVGLFSVGGFYKNIANFIYADNTYVVDEGQFIEAYPDQLTLGATVTGFVNNPNDAQLWGLELEWQSNFWFLPGVWSGLVVGINYTYTHSETIYPQTDPTFRRVGFVRVLDGSKDSSYKARLIDQPDHSFNATIGFDHKGFSARGSMRLKSDIFRSAHFFPQLRQATETLTLFDISVTQRLPAQGLSVFLNAANVSEATDTNSNFGTGWASSEQFFGMTAQMGVRYSL